MKIEYPSVDDIINANKKAVELLRATKAEKHEILAPKYKIEEIIEKAKGCEGSIKKKAAFLLVEINRKHLFASANKRTSFLVSADFLLANEGKIPLKRKEDVKFLIEIREGKRDLEEVIRWLDG
ncbi:MAG: type II toxin-antitoxin system death-on-curing family toxin [Candidatus Aenigmarchaeota archaeon]|nr:type II toxin-antitoxin system death-on-curing family toxin [Candidatus Aenigmarchaeota archaeon]